MEKPDIFKDRSNAAKIIARSRACVVDMLFLEFMVIELNNIGADYAVASHAIDEQNTKHVKRMLANNDECEEQSSIPVQEKQG